MLQQLMRRLVQCIMNEKIIIFLTFLHVINCQINRFKQDQDNSGAYVPSDDGKYIHDDSGRYIPDNSGQYHDDGTGRYKHQANPYKHIFDQQGQGSATNINANFIKPVDFKVPKRQVQYGKYDDNRWKIIRWANDVKKDGFQWQYETENEIIGEEKAKVLNKNTKDETIAAEGFYRYTGPDNVIYNVEYTADEKGFIPKADHLPLALQRALEYYSKAP